MASGLISVVFSFRNEEAILPLLIDRVEKVLTNEPEDHELIFINDDSTDRSLEVLLNARKENPRVKIVNMSRRFGVAECVMAGLELSRGDAVIIMDSDLQDPPETLPALLAEWRRGADVVHTVRKVRRGEPAIKLWLTRQAYKIIQWGSHRMLPVEAGDFKLFSRRAVTHLSALKENDPYIRGLAVWIGFQQAFVPYERVRREAGVSKFPIFSSRNPWKTAVNGLTAFSFTPLYALLLLGIIGLVIDAGLVIGLLAALLSGETPLMLGAVALGLFFWSTLMFGLGVVGIYVARTYKDARARPRFIVRETIGI